MIDPKELRYGNLVTATFGTESVYSILEIKQATYTIHDTEKWHSIRHKDVNPIPVTNEWLRTLGLTGEIANYTNDVIYNDGKGFAFWCYNKSVYQFATGSVSVRFEYIHQLQNLYFALTGRELSINK